MTKRVWTLIMVSIFTIVTIPSVRAVTNIWQIGGVDTFWTTTGNWFLGGTPGASDQARFQNILGNYTQHTVTLNTSETVDSVDVGSPWDRFTFPGTGALTVNNDFYLETWSDAIFEPTLNVGGRFQGGSDTAYDDGRARLRFGNAGYTSGNVFGGGIYNYTFKFDIGGATTISNTILVKASVGLNWRNVDNHWQGITQISGTPTFGPGLTFDVLRAGTLWFPGATDFSNVSTLNIDGGMLRLDASSGNTFPVYGDGIHVGRGRLAITSNGSLGSDANGLTLGSRGGFGYLMGYADNSAGNYITRPVTLAGNGGGADVTALLASSHMNFATDIDGPGKLIKNGELYMYLRNAGSGTTSSYAGGTAVANGVLWVESNRSLGTGDVSIHEGAWLWQTAAGNVDSSAKVLIGGSPYNPGMLVLTSDMTPPAIDPDSTGTIGLEGGAFNQTITEVGSAFLGARNADPSSPAYYGATLAAGAGNIYRIGGIMDVTGWGGWQQTLNLDINNGDGGAGVLTGANDLLVQQGGGVAARYKQLHRHHDDKAQPLLRGCSESGLLRAIPVRREFLWQCQRRGGNV